MLEERICNTWNAYMIVLCSTDVLRKLFLRLPSFSSRERKVVSLKWKENLSHYLFCVVRLMLNASL